jgi:membrane protease YdiL (CAAX protease family)
MALAPSMKITMASGDKSLDVWVLMPMFILSFLLLLIAVQFKDATANAYALLIILTFAFYAIAQERGFAGWIGLGSKRDLKQNVFLGVGIFAGVVVGGGFIGVPFAIGTSVVLNYFYRWFAAVFIEEPLFRGVAQPTFEKLLGNPFSASIIVSVLWAGFHIVALQGNTSQIVGLVIIGIVFSMANNYAKSLVPSLVAHGLWNLKQVVGI